MNELRDPMFNPEQSKIWVDHLPAVSKPLSAANLQQADGKIQKLHLDQSKLQFQAGCLSLARDASQLASLHAAEMNSERASRMAKVAHLKQENQIGSGIVTSHMVQRCAVASGPMSVLKPAVQEAWFKQNA